jgi:hypothetical protein
VEGFQWETTRVLDAGRAHPHDAKDLAEKRFLRWRSVDNRVHRANPLAANPTLFRVFAQLEPTEEAFLAFANEFGWLGVALLLQGEVTAEGQRVVTFNSRAEGEPLWRWRSEHQNMAAVNLVLTAIQDENVQELRNLFVIEDDGVRYESGVSFEWICSTRMQLKEWLWEWGNQARTEEERIIRFASGWAQRQINEAMAERGASRRSLTSVRVLFNHESRSMRLHVTPDTLLGAMWLQCARVLSENPKFRTCENCGKWFELSPDLRRRHAIYCSPRCKVAAYRKRNPKGKRNPATA